MFALFDIKNFEILLLYFVCFVVFLDFEKKKIQIILISVVAKKNEIHYIKSARCNLNIKTIYTEYIFVNKYFNRYIDSYDI